MSAFSAADSDQQKQCVITSQVGCDAQGTPDSDLGEICRGALRAEVKSKGRHTDIVSRPEFAFA